MASVTQLKPPTAGEPKDLYGMGEVPPLGQFTSDSITTPHVLRCSRHAGNLADSTGNAMCPTPVVP